MYTFSRNNRNISQGYKNPWKSAVESSPENYDIPSTTFRQASIVIDFQA